MQTKNQSLENNTKNSVESSPSITIKNFKSYKNATLPLAPLTLLIGANASGKSNAIEALRFLSWVAGGERLSTLKNRVNDSDKVVRGSVRDLVSNGEENFILQYYFDNLTYEGIFSVKESDIQVISEIVRFIDSFIYFLKTKKYPFFPNLSKFYNESLTSFILDKQEQNTLKDFRMGNFTDKIILDNRLNSKESELFFAERSIAMLEKVKMPVADIWFNFRNLRLQLQEYCFFDFIVSNITKDSIPESELRPDGSNLAGVMYQICQDNPNNKAKLLKIIQSLPEQQITDIKFYPDRRRRVEFALVEGYGATADSTTNECTMDLLSDGTLKVLAIATALLSVPEGATLVIEEIDNSIHPSRANVMLTLMREIATERNLKLLLSTHNPALMDALPDEALADVVFCYRDPNEGDSRLQRLGDLEDYVGLTVQGSLGDLVTQGVVERFVKHPTTNEERKQQAKAWLDSMWEED